MDVIVSPAVKYRVTLFDPKFKGSMDGAYRHTYCHDIETAKALWTWLPSECLVQVERFTEAGWEVVE